MRLIDADALKKAFNETDGSTDEIIDAAPTIEAPVVAEIKIDTDELIERIKKEYDIVE